jgi:hypothetical protein
MPCLPQAGPSSAEEKGSNRRSLFRFRLHSRCPSPGVWHTPGDARLLVMGQKDERGRFVPKG